MEKRFNLGIFLAGLLAGAVPDLVSYLMVLLENHPLFSTRIRYFREVSAALPWMLFIFSLSFALAAYATTAHRGRSTPSGAIQFILLVPVGTWLIRFFLLIAAGALTRYGVGIFVSTLAIEVIANITICAIAMAGLGIDIGIAGFAASALLAIVSIVFGHPPYPLTFVPRIYYTLFGAILSYYMAIDLIKVQRERMSANRD